jgi:hypothetical protein
LAYSLKQADKITFQEIIIMVDEKWTKDGRNKTGMAPPTSAGQQSES